MSAIPLRTVSIGDLGKVITGKTPPTSRPELFGSEHPFITPTDIDGVNRSVATERFVSDAGLSTFRNQAIPAGAVCFVCIGATIGKICVANRMSLTNQQINSIVVDESSHDPTFVYYALRALAPNVKALAGGAATPIISKSSFSQIKLAVPQVDVQRRIAAILSAYDDLIENNTRRIAILEEMARRIYEEWFVHFRFPGHEKARMVDSESGPAPEGWAYVRLDTLADVNARSIKRGKEPEEISYVDISSVSTASINQRERMKFTDAPGRARRIVKDGDIIWACVRPNRKSYAAIIDPEADLVVSTGFAVLSATDIPWPYLYEAVTTEDFVGYLVNHAKGAAYPAVGADDFERAKILRPDPATLHRFNAVVEPMLRLNASLARKNENLRATRDLLLPKLISGELDVSPLPEPEAAVA